eukprot:tig00000865_g5085.t1
MTSFAVAPIAVPRASLRIAAPVCRAAARPVQASTSRTVLRTAFRPAQLVRFEFTGIVSPHFAHRTLTTASGEAPKKIGSARASHILVKDEGQCDELVEKINGGGDFEDLAEQYSTCPSGRSGGDLGWFGPGAMVPQFDKVCFSAENLNKVVKVQTRFGWHVVKVTGQKEGSGGILGFLQGLFGK